MQYNNKETENSRPYQGNPTKRFGIRETIRKDSTAHPIDSLQKSDFFSFIAWITFTNCLNWLFPSSDAITMTWCEFFAICHCSVFVYIYCRFIAPAIPSLVTHEMILLRSLRSDKVIWRIGSLEWMSNVSDLNEITLQSKAHFIPRPWFLVVFSN